MRKFVLALLAVAAVACSTAAPPLVNSAPTIDIPMAVAHKMVRVEVFEGIPDRDNKVVGAHITLGPSSAVTDGAGNALLQAPPGAQKLTVVAAGYKPFEDAVVVDAAQNAQTVRVSLAPAGRTGRVRLSGRSFVDDKGPWLALGTSLFWAVRDADTDHLHDNLEWAKQQGVDFVRVIAETTDWADGERIDPSWPDYEARLRKVRDAAWEHGLRVEWTVFGGNKLSASEQERVLATVLAVCDERPETVQFIEISNESNGFADAASRMRRFAITAAERGYVVALTSAAHADSLLYAGSAATIATEHFDRAMREFGWRPVRQPWGYWERQNMPPAFVNNEPIGIGSSVAADDDPLRLAMGAVATWVAGGSAHVVHTGAGIYGVQKTHPVGGNRPPNLWEQPTLEPTLKALVALRGLLPDDLPAWSRQNHYWSGHPFVFGGDVGDVAIDRRKGIVRGYGAVSGNNFVVALTGILGEITLTPKRAMAWRAYNPLTGNEIASGEGPVTFRESEVGQAVIIVGSYIVPA